MGLKESIGASDFGYYIKSSISHGLIWVQADVGWQTMPESACIGRTDRYSHALRDELYVAQCRLSGLTFSRLHPYEEWDKLVDETKRDYGPFIGSASRRSVDSGGHPVYQQPSTPPSVREIRIKSISTNWLMFRTDAPQAVASFFQRFELVDVESGYRVILTAAQEPTSPQGPAVGDPRRRCVYAHQSSPERRAALGNN